MQQTCLIAVGATAHHDHRAMLELAIAWDRLGDSIPTPVAVAAYPAAIALAAAWVNRDARRRGLDSNSATGWTVLVALFAMFLLPVWLLTRPKRVPPSTSETPGAAARNPRGCPPGRW